VNYVAEWARVFALTLAVEMVVAVPLLGREQRLARRSAAVLFAQLATHPLVWFVLPELRLGRLPFLVLAESWAVVAELTLYRLVFPALSWSRALAVSALANGASAALGTFLR
jgi:hypothetical protein